MAKFLMKELIQNGDVITARLGAGTGAGNNVDDKEVNKIVKNTADSRYDLAAVGDPIEAFVKAVESATLDGYTIGSVAIGGRKEVTFDGSEAAGTGALAVGDYVVTGTVVAKGTALASYDAVKVRKATVQPGGVPATLTEAGRMSQLAAYAWRVVSLGSVGTGAVGTKGVIARVK